jgi:hypothetical protein
MLRSLVGSEMCRRVRVGTRYRVWVRSRPTLAAEGDSFQGADEQLSALICEAMGDGESVREYDPPRPGMEGSGLLFRLTLVSGESYATIGNAEELFTKGLCPQCKQPRGERTKAALALASIESAVDGGLATTGPGGGGSSLDFFSERFLAQLSPGERAAFEWRTVECRSRTRRVFYELVDARVIVPFVVLSDLAAALWNVPSASPGLTLTKCDTCGWLNEPLYVFPSGGLPYWYVSATDLPDPLPTCFAVGGASGLSLGFTRGRWSEIVGRAGTRGIASSDVGVVAQSLVEPNPPRQLLSEQQGAGGS